MKSGMDAGQPSSPSAGFSMSTSMLRRLAASAALTFALLPSAWATSPAGGTLNSTDKTMLQADGGPYVVQNPAANCAAGPPLCDEYALTVDLPTTYAASNPNDKIQIDLVPGSSTDDLDLMLTDADGVVVSTSGNGAGESEQITIPAGSAMQSFLVKIVPFAAPGGTAKLTITLIKGSSTGGGVGTTTPEDPCAQSGVANSGFAQLAPGVATALKTLSASTLYGAYLHFSYGTESVRNDLLAKYGFTKVKSFYPWANSVYVRGPVSAFLAIAKEPNLSYIEDNRKLHYLGDTQEWATRTRVAQESVSGGPYYDGAGNILDGTGVTVSVVDSGLNGTHPDFAGRILHNYLIKGSDLMGANTGPIDVGYTSSDTTGGHGTHCNGIAIGGGQASDPQYPVPASAPNFKGTYTGVAPKATILAYGVGEAIAVLAPDTAFMDILENYDSYSPRVRVISNSYGNGAGSAYVPGDTTSCLVKALVNKGVALTYAAGNDGGDGSTDQTNGACKDPTPGVICVASYDDAGEGNRNHPLSGFSSRSKKGNPENYVDIAAPGDLYTATCAQTFPGQAICTGSDGTAPAEDQWQPYYGTISGTSMATPHVAGALALLFQAKPTLSPAQAEKLLQDTSIKIGPGYEPDPQNPGGSINFAYGSGLMDFPAALDKIGIRKAGLPAAAQEFTVFEGDTDATALDAAADVTKLTMTETAPNVSPSGITFKMTLADATGFTTAGAITYQLDMNVAGHHYFSSVVLDSAGMVTIPGVSVSDGNTAKASSASLNGNELTVFLPYNQMGYPAIGEPIHNIRVITTDDNGNLQDRAPSPMGVANPNAPLANPGTGNAAVDLFPAFGRAFTILQPSGIAPPSLETSCVVPGITGITDAAGDATVPLPAYDILSVGVAEPPEMEGKLVFTLKVAGLSPLQPNTLWAVRFSTPVKPENGDADWFVGMQSFGGAASFVFGTVGVVDATATSAAIYTIQGDIDAASSFNADGTITLIVDKATIGNPKIGDGLAQLVATTRPITNPQTVTAGSQDTAEGDTYFVLGTDICKAGSTPTPTPTVPVPVPMIGSPSLQSGPTSSGGRFGGALGLLLLPMLAGGALLRRRRTR